MRWRAASVAALGSQPFRLQSSACWGRAGDARLVCSSCHDPHRPADRDPLAYDARCLACHGKVSGVQGKQRTPGACTVGTSGCVTCHMPKYEVPEMRYSFTDHLIRVVRPRGR